MGDVADAPDLQPNDGLGGDPGAKVDADVDAGGAMVEAMVSSLLRAAVLQWGKWQVAELFEQCVSSVEPAAEVLEGLRECLKMEDMTRELLT